METIYNGNRSLTISLINEIAENVIIDNNRKYIVMINITSDFEINKIEKNISNLVNKNCYEIYCTNFLSGQVYAEKLHDTIDDYIEKNNYLKINTSFENNGSLDNICFYFFHTVGKYNDVDFYVIIGNKKIEKSIKKYFNKYCNRERK